MCSWQNLIFPMAILVSKMKIITSKSILIVNFWIVLEVSLNIFFKFLNNKKLYFLKLGLIFVGSVLIHFSKYHFFLEMWSLWGLSLSNFVSLPWIWHNPYSYIHRVPWWNASNKTLRKHPKVNLKVMKNYLCNPEVRKFDVYLSIFTLVVVW